MIDPLQAQIWPIFIAETREHLEALSAATLGLEQPVDHREPALLAGLLRTAHSLKGSAGSLGFTQIEHLAHVLEDALQSCPPEPLLTAPQVEAVLAAVRAVDGAVRAMEDGTGEGRLEDPERLERALVVALSRNDPRDRPAAPTARSDEGPPPSALVELWPVFRGEALENAALLEEGARGWRGGPAADERALLSRVAEALTGSGAALGVAALEALGREAEALLSAPTAEGGPVLASLAARVEDVVEALDRRLDNSAPGGPAPAPPALPPVSLPDPFRREVEGLLQRLEALAPALLSPAPGPRQAAAVEARRLAHELEGTTGSVVSPLAGLALQLHAQARRLGAEGPEGSQATAAFAGLLVDLLTAFDAPPAAPPPSPSPSPARVPVPPSSPPPLRPSSPRPAGGERAGAEAMVRVSSLTIDAVAAQMEALVLARARLDRRTKAMSAVQASVQELLVCLQQQVSAFRGLDAAQPLEAAQRTLEDARATAGRLHVLVTESSRDVQDQGVLGAQVRDALRDLRTVPAETLLEPLRRVVRDVAGRLGKQVTLEFEGRSVRLDRRIVEALKDPLLHLLRNAVDHGIEPPEARVREGKPATGLLVVRVGAKGHRTVIDITDDGQGINVEAVRERAVSRGLLPRAEVQAMTDAQVTNLIFYAGFSTAREVSALSGRGVGLDVVQEAVTRMGGTVEVHSTHGQGSHFVLELPQTIGATLALIVVAGGVRVAVPVDGVERVLQLIPALLGTVAGHTSVLVGREPVGLTSLARLLGLGAARFAPADQHGPALVLGAGGRRAVLAVDEVSDQMELVVHSLGRHLAQAPHLGGAALMDDGSVVPVLNPAELLRLARPAAPGAPEVKRTRLLVADDSLTTRSAMRSLLELAGFEVAVATNGEEALRVLREAPCTLVVTDVQMPGIDGLELTRVIRADPALSALPVILVTSLDRPEDRAAGMEAGADCYLIKREVERGKLLELVRQLLPVGA
ncbi:MAG: Hpt domain-containing protein [Archangium sp.]|nr:Hpt domain-containing protein [Archangium sp.]